ncbi:MAG: cobyric acid synthase [Desulfuromonadales bacterium]|nr:cobyric acid synthase [Desulfuromonadales bacterium]
MNGKLYIVGIGPGGAEHITPAAARVIAVATLIAGYQTYLDFIPQLLGGKKLLSTGMMQEVERCRAALDAAQAGEIVALVSSGDAGIYGMAGLALEMREALNLDLEIEVIPGVSAVQAAASRLGAPLMHDFAVISLSDLLTPWPLIRTRLKAAAEADFVVALYNPKSRGRTTQLSEACAIFRACRPATTPVGIVRNACRNDESLVITDLAGLVDAEVDMLSLVIIGNASTFIDRFGKMVTPRGYEVRSGTTPPFAKGGSENHKARALFVGGTGSDVGKSVVTAGLCRLFKRRGYHVAPFKAQNMALNSAVTPEGGEIGRAQALQAAACGIAAHTDMNPILLKPNSATGSQVIVAGKALGNMSVSEYHRYKPEAFAAVEAAFARLQAQYELVVLEGAGSIAEINLKAHDIVNLRAAQMAAAPVLLVADIDRGGVFAAIIGTIELLPPEERASVAGIIINRFRGDASLLTPGITAIEERTGIPVLGVIPWIKLQLPEEDSVALGRKPVAAQLHHTLRIGVIRLPHISNYTDFDPLEGSAGVELLYISEASQMTGLDLLILPGSKSTIPDLSWLRQSGITRAIHDYRQAGGEIIGICGGYQMLGRTVTDPDGVESDLDLCEGLGFLDVTTILTGEKQTHQVAGCALAGAEQLGLGQDEVVSGYEIHMGETTIGPLAQPLLRLTMRSGCTVVVNDGAISADGRVWGSYLHGLFDNESIRQPLLSRLRQKRGLETVEDKAATELESELDRLADHLQAHLDVERILALLVPPGGQG